MKHFALVPITVVKPNGYFFDVVEKVHATSARQACQLAVTAYADRQPNKGLELMFMAHTSRVRMGSIVPNQEEDNG